MKNKNQSMTPKTLTVKVIFCILILSTVACKKKDKDFPEPEISALEIQNAYDIVADTGKVGKHTFYSLRENKIISSADSATSNWDIAFKGTTIIINSGASGPGNGAAQVVNGIFEELTSAPETGYKVDGATLAIPASSDASWYHYTSATSPEHAVLPIAGKIIVVQTADGNYAKIEIVSYYKGNPSTTTSEFADLNTRPDGRYYNFRYVYQPDGTKSFK